MNARNRVAALIRARRGRPFAFVLVLCSSFFVLCAAAAVQRAGAFDQSRDHPAIAYSTGPVSNAVSELVERIQQGHVRLTFDPANGYLRSVLEALAVPVESQILVYSETSFQARKINRRNPRAIYFNDRVAVGFVRGGDILEFAAQDARLGTVFYHLPQTPNAQISRNNSCLSCHLSWDTRGVPGPLVMSVVPRQSDNQYANGGIVDHHSPIAERWGGWYVTGTRVPKQQLGNVDLLQPDMPASGPVPVPAPRSVEGLFDLGGYLTPYSDIVALMVLEHQAQATNLITRAAWEYRIASPSSGALPARVQEAVDELVDYLLFVDEAPLPTPVRGSSGFAERFAALGPKDSKGRSLRQLQLDTRLMEYPCSYMIYSPAFEALPEAVKGAVFAKLSLILEGGDRRPAYAHLTPSLRAAIVEILRETAPPSIRHFL